MARSTKEWIGKTDDSMPTEHCKRRIVRRQDGKCAACLEGSPTVNLDTGEPVDGPIPTFPYVPFSTKGEAHD